MTEGVGRELDVAKLVEAQPALLLQLTVPADKEVGSHPNDDDLNNQMYM